MGYYFRQLLIALGYKICPMCGSEHITESGFPGSNLRWNCQDCGTTTRAWC